MFGQRWADAPRSVRLAVGAETMVLGYGAGVHVVQFVGQGFHPYSWAPTWLAIYFTSLTLADPLAAILLWLRRAAGLYLAVCILVTDAVANGYADYELSIGSAVARVSHAVISILAVAALSTAPWLHSWLRRHGTRR
ncbi:hypothetical protein HC031_22655 [Planosporangium thailandense]|uniref:Uncharacterized protein n=1 Tax=Planosporangium thailandense TaxID=765197 RepID=A0ABX0Y2A8_9ACTN|nr:hypothetical protein [Planosporangium thailandense]NJC72497.1 hypothetical protein [Planosporangium thailandense]